MPFRGLTENECGNANPTLKLGEHFFQDQAQRDIRNVPQFQKDSSVKLVHEFLEDTLSENFQTFRTDELLEEVNEIERCLDRSTTESSIPSKNVSATENWIPESSTSLPTSHFFLDPRVVPPVYPVYSSLPPRPLLQPPSSQTQNNTSLSTDPNFKPVEVTIESLKGPWAWGEITGDDFFKEETATSSKDKVGNEVNNEREETLSSPVKSREDLGGSTLVDESKGLQLGSDVNERQEKIGEISQTHTDLGSDSISEDTQVNKQEREDSGFDFSQKAADSKYIETLRKNQTSQCENFSEGDLDSREEVEEPTTTEASDNFVEETEESLLVSEEEDSVETETDMHNQMFPEPDMPWHQYERYYFEANNPMRQLEDPYQEGMKYMEIGDFPTAALCFEAAVQFNPRNAKAWQYLGACQASNEQDIHAIAALRQCLELEPNNLSALMSLAISYTNENQGNLACLTLWNWLFFNTKYSDVVTARGPIYLDDNPAFLDPKVYMEVLEMFLEAANKRPSGDVDAEVQCALGVLYNLMGQSDKAVECFKVAVAVDPDDAKMWNRLGATLANGQRSAEAVEAYYASLNINPGYVRARYNLGVSCLNLGANRDALVHLIIALKKQTMGATNRSTGVGSVGDSIWSTVRMVLSYMGRKDLFEVVEQRNLEVLAKAFGVE